MARHIRWALCACVGAVLLATVPALAGAQSAASLAGRVVIDGDAREYTAVTGTPSGVRLRSSTAASISSRS